MKKIITSCLYGLGIGIVLYYVFLIAYGLLYVSGVVDVELLLPLTHVASGLLVCTGICFRNKSLWLSLLRLLLSVCSFFVTMIINGYLGTVVILWRRFGIEGGVMTGNAMGLLYVMTMVFVFGIALVTVLIREIVRMIRRTILKKRLKASEIKEN